MICRCSERRESLPPGTGSRPARLWRVVQRFCHRSAFGGYRVQASQYSGVTCLRCGVYWRTRAKYVLVLDDATVEDLNTRPGIKGHDRKMITFNREPYVGV